MLPNQPSNPDFETLLQDALGIRLAKVSRSSIKFSISDENPSTRIVRRTTVISIVEKRGKLSNLPTLGGLK